MYCSIQVRSIDLRGQPTHADGNAVQHSATKTLGGSTGFSGAHAYRRNLIMRGFVALWQLRWHMSSCSQTARPVGLWGKKMDGEMHAMLSKLRCGIQIETQSLVVQTLLITPNHVRYRGHPCKKEDLI
jgi:hypothetical protein